MKSVEFAAKILQKIVYFQHIIYLFVCLRAQNKITHLEHKEKVGIKQQI